MNLVIIAGRLGKDPEVRSTGSGTQVMSFSVATDYRHKQGDEWVSATTWHDCLLWKPSDYVVNNLHKGTFVSLSGRIQKRSFEGRDGTKRYAFEIVVDRVEFAPTGDRQQSDAPVSAPRSARRPDNVPGWGTPAATPPAGVLDDSEDVPF